MLESGIERIATKVARKYHALVRTISRMTMTSYVYSELRQFVRRDAERGRNCATYDLSRVPVTSEHQYFAGAAALESGARHRITALIGWTVRGCSDLECTREVSHLTGFALITGAETLKNPEEGLRFGLRIRVFAQGLFESPPRCLSKGGEGCDLA